MRAKVARRIRKESYNVPLKDGQTPKNCYRNMKRDYMKKRGYYAKDGN